jgi:phenylacetate-CoA ligase
MWASKPPLDELALQPGDMQRLWDEGIARTVRHAYDHSPFYRRKLEACGLSPSDIRSTADLVRLAPTTKREVSEAGRDLWCVPPESVVDISTTSGTTGVPTLYPMTEADVQRLAYSEWLSFRCVGLTPADTVLLAVTMDRCFIAGLAYFEGLRRTGCTVVRVGSGPPAMLLGLLERLGATAVVSVPSFLKKVALYAAEQRIDLGKSSVQKLVCIGEPLRDAELEMTPLGAQIAEAWGAAVFATYGITELAASLCECPAGCGGHLHPELLHVEILDDAGRPVPDGQVGEVVASSLAVEAMPLLRFRTGDCAFLRRERCACGRWTPRVGPILSRKNQAMKIKGTSVYPAAVQRVLDDLGTVQDYVMIATSGDVLSDELEVVVVLRGAGPGARRVLDDVRERLRAELKVAPAVRSVGAEELERLRDSANYRKKRVFIDRRNAADHA